MQAEEKRGVGYIFGLSFRSHVPCAAVQGVFEVANAASKFNDRFFGFGDISYKQEAVLLEVGEGIEESCVLRHVVAVVDPLVVTDDLLLVPEYSIVMSYAAS